METIETPEKYVPEHLSKWSLPDSYYGQEWPNHYVFLSRHRDSDCLTESNWRVALAILEKLPPFEHPEEQTEDEYTSRYVVREGHWAVGWVEWICIHEDDEEALKLAEEVTCRLSEYLVLDASDHSELEDQEAQRIWQDCYSAKERIKYIKKHRSQFEFRDWQDIIGCVRGRYFAGYASELINW